MTDAMVVCRQLGFPAEGEVIRFLSRDLGLGGTADPHVFGIITRTPNFFGEAEQFGVEASLPSPV